MESVHRKDENAEELYKIATERYYEVADINFGKKRNHEIEILGEMDKLDRERLTVIHAVKMAEKEGQSATEK
jgi:undecaprenyl pyrophosphate synthase